MIKADDNETTIYLEKILIECGNSWSQIYVTVFVRYYRVIG